MTPITVVLYQTTPVLVRSLILAAALACTAWSAGPTQAQTTSPPADAPVSSDTPVDPAAVGASIPEAAISAEPELPVVMVPLPTLIGEAWTPAPRTKTTGCVSLGGLPDPACTPGALDPRVTEATAAMTVCTVGYTKTVRPHVSVTNRIKREQMVAYGLQDQPLSGFELDHLISLELGGAPADVANLWPESWTGDGNARQKDAVETHLKREVCRGAISLNDAQRMIATDWLAVYHGNGLTPAP